MKRVRIIKISAIFCEDPAIASISAKYAAHSRASIIVKNEKSTQQWIVNSCQKRIPLDGDIIQQKAFKIYKHLKEHGESSLNPDFEASKCRFE
ncbi:hypothetical protein NPIL_449831 [Nephila pilipes]|uniref:Uncharacterized protein n=1 Tax=Nephila pilipes TaxID=299642 RepID=A0A8X6NT46_NEPPI|nr:hypothetical protein NPIL_449831 [Nephila pilipes]